MYRSSTGNLGFYDDPPRGGERWDRDRFERMGRRGRDEHDHYRFEERERFPGGRRDIDFHEDYDRRGGRVMERERFRDQERFNRRTDFDDDTPSEIANRTLAPYRRKSIVDRDVDFAPRRPARPQYIRRQSSLDIFDRRPLPRYGEVEKVEREEWRPPTNVPIPLPIRERRRSPPRYREVDFEEVDFREREREREPRRRDRTEEYREVEVHRARSRRRRSVARSVRSSSSSSFEEVSPVRANWGKRGKTRMPKRLVKKQAVIELGYPFEEEDDFIVIRRALEKEHIDEIIKVSENYKDEKVTYVYEDKKTEVVEPPAHHSHHTTVVVPPPPPSIHHAHSVRSSSPSRHEVVEERIEESNRIGGPLNVLLPGHEERRIVRTDRDIKDEIRALDHERRLLKYEREGDFEIIERREPHRDVIRVEKDRKVHKEPNPKVVAAMMATLT